MRGNHSIVGFHGLGEGLNYLMKGRKVSCRAKIRDNFNRKEWRLLEGIPQVAYDFHSSSVDSTPSNHEKSYLIAILLSALAMFLWGAVYWMNPLASAVFQVPEDDALAQSALSEHFPSDGVYWVPGNMEDADSRKQLHQAGPIALVSITHTGKDPMAASVMILGFVHMIGYAILLLLLLRASSALRKTYLCRVQLMALVGLILAFFTELGAMIWFYQPVAYSLLLAGYAFSVTLAGGAVLAIWVRESADA